MQIGTELPPAHAHSVVLNGESSFEHSNDIHPSTAKRCKVQAQRSGLAQNSGPARRFEKPELNVPGLMPIPGEAITNLMH